jgi:hypothetical protein
MTRGIETYPHVTPDTAILLRDIHPFKKASQGQVKPGASDSTEE